MKRLIATALAAVFLSMGIQGCYTVLKKSEPATGEKVYNNSEYYPPDYNYYDYYSPYFFSYGWYNNPFYFAYPGYFDSFYRPWWYDPNYYYDGGYYNNGQSPSNKGSRGRGDMPSVPGGNYTPPALPAVPGGTYQAPASTPSNPPANPPANNPPTDNNNGGKATRGRR